MKKILFIIVILLLLFFGILKRVSKSRKGIERKIEKEIPVEIAKVKKALIEEEIQTVGEIEPYQKVVVYSEATGKVEKLNVDVGDYVRKGELIAKIDYEKRKLEYENLKKQVEAGEINLKNLKKDYERFKKLYKEGVIAEKKLDDIKTSYKAYLNQLEGLKKQLKLSKVRMEDATIYAPADGIISKRFVDPGEIITESTMMKNSPIVEIVNINKVKVKIGVSEEDIGKIRTGQNVFLRVDAYPDKKFTGNITRISPVANKETKTVDVEVIVNNPSHLLKPGMYCKAKIITGKRKALIIPLDAVIKFPASGNWYCFVVEDGVAERKSIKLGKICKNYAEVIDGLKEGDIVITTSQGILQSGKKIKVLKEEKK